MFDDSPKALVADRELPTAPAATKISKVSYPARSAQMSKHAVFKESSKTFFSSVAVRITLVS